MATFSLLIASLLFLANSTFAASNYFENPPDIGTATTNPSNFQVYKVGDILDVSWVTNANVVDLIINQKGTPNTEIDRPPNSESIAQSKSSYTWKVNTDGTDGGAKFNLAFNNQFNFMLFVHGQTSTIATSGYFNVSNATIDAIGKKIVTSSSASLSPTRLSTSSTASSSTSATSASAASETASATSKSATPTPTPASTGLSSGAKVGLGVGLGIAGVAAIAGVALWYILSLRKKRERKEMEMDEHRGGADHKPPPLYANENWAPPSELQDQNSAVHPTKVPLLSSPPSELQVPPSEIDAAPPPPPRSQTHPYELQ